MIICSPQYGLKPNSNAGGEVYDEMVLKGLADFGNQIEIILPYGKSYDKNQKNWNVYNLGIPYIHFSYLFNFAILPKLYKIYKKTKFKILRVHSPYFVGIGALLFKKFFAKDIKIVTTYFHFEPFFLFNVIDKLLIKKWDHIITISEATRNDLINKYDISPEKITLAYCGISKKYKKSDSVNKSDKKQITFCGILIKRKNVDFIIDIASKIGTKDAVFNIIGDGPEMDNLKAYAKEKNAYDKFVFWGYLSEDKKIEILQASDIFLFPSFMEGFGLAPVEAMACGVPTLVSDRGSLPEVVGDGGLILPLDEDKWIDSIVRILSDKELSKELSKKAVEKSAKYNWEEVVGKINSAMTKINNEN